MNASSNVLNEFVYSYNTANQITQITEPSKTRTFGYDNADRLTSSTSTVSGQNESYTFDDVGNRTSSHLSSVYGYQQGSFNRLSSTQQASYSFDNNGNLTSKTEGTAKWYYSYDRENRLMNAAKFGGLMSRANESVNYQYDAFGRRVVRQDKKTGRTEFTHDGMDVIQDRFEKNDGNISTTNYVNGLGIDDKLKVKSGTTSRYFLTDHLGSTVGMSDTNGNVTESASYDSFGRTISSNLTTRYGFTGREADEKTGLMYYRARFYDPQIGRFTSEDPIGFEGGVNWFAYVENNPINFFDPYGLDTIKLPPNPGPNGSNLPSGWKPDTSHKYPHGERWIAPSGDEGLDFHEGTPGKPAWGGKDHWHVIRPDRNGDWKTDESVGHKGGHFNPGEDVEIKPENCKSTSLDPMPFTPVGAPPPSWIPWWLRFVPRFPLIPIMIDPCIVDPAFCPHNMA